MNYYCSVCGLPHNSAACPHPTTTTDPTPETAKDRQLIYWQQQCTGQELTIERLTAENGRLKEQGAQARKDLFDSIDESIKKSAHIKLLDAEIDAAEARLKKIETAGWRSCIDHIIKPEHPCPICHIKLLEEVVGAVRLWRRCGFSVTQGDAICDSLAKLDQETDNDT